jgi:glycosyltransferase involved in cell wall biosynthesis
MNLHEQAPSVDALRAGAFDGLTIMRYAPFYRERWNGGVEQTLRLLNRWLLRRHRMRVLQVYRVRDLEGSRIEVERMEKGQIVWIPAPYQRTHSRFADLPKRAWFIYNQTRLARRQDGEGAGRAILSATKAVFRRRLEDLRHRSVILSDPLSGLLLTCKVDLLALHGLTYDAGNLIRRAQNVGIPYVLISHFDNSLFSEPYVREWIPKAAGIGSVSGKGLPDSVCDRCVNLSDAIDTEFFAPGELPSSQPYARLTMLLPALIKPGKGQEDLLRAARILATRNLDFRVCFAGAVESESLYQDLRSFVAAHGLEDRAVFLGELDQEAIRNWYALSSVVVLPTYSEGLGRVLLEAQAMQKPVVAYDCGGVGEAVLPNETGFLVKTGDVQALADRIDFLFKNEAERVRMGKQGREFVLRRFGISAFVQRHEAFYLRALSGGDGTEGAKNDGARHVHTWD